MTGSDTETKVPWLGDIPSSAGCSRAPATAMRKTNLIVFLTPHIVRDPDDLAARDDPQAARSSASSRDR